MRNRTLVYHVCRQTSIPLAAAVQHVCQKVPCQHARILAFIAGAPTAAAAVSGLLETFPLHRVETSTQQQQSLAANVACSWIRG